MLRLFARYVWISASLLFYGCSDLSELAKTNSDESELASAVNSEKKETKKTYNAADAKKLSAKYCGKVKGFMIMNEGTLVANECLLSNNKKSLLVMQTDGNLVLYNVADNSPLWSSGTMEPGSHLSLQLDGNLVIYNASGTPIWETATTNRGSGFLSIQDDQNLVLYLHDSTGNYTAEWSSKYGLRKLGDSPIASAPVATPPAPATPIAPPASPAAVDAATKLVNDYCGKLKGFKISVNEELKANECLMNNNKKALLVMQEDGNLVLYRVSDRSPLWSSSTFQPGSHLSIQTDGNLVIYNNSGSAIWATNTSGQGAGFLTLQDDSNLVLYLSNGGAYKAVWSSQYGSI